MCIIRAGTLPSPYCFGMVQLPSHGDVVFITGGEKDVMSLAAHGFYAICFNSETATIPHSIIEMLSLRFQHIVIMYDCDDTGLASMEKARNGLEDFGVLTLRLPLSGMKPDKDISDFFAAGHTANELQTLLVRNIEQLHSQSLQLLDTCELNYATPPEKSRTIISVANVPLGTCDNLCCVSGSEGTGKSNFISALISRMAATTAAYTAARTLRNGQATCISSLRTSVGEDNIVGFCVHLDETTPHIHCVLMPIDKENKFAFKRLFAGSDVYEFKERMRRLHDEFAEVNKKWGLERGDSVIETGAKHRSTTEYWRSLSGECTDLERQIDDHKATIRSLLQEISIAERRVKGLKTMVNNLEKKKEELERKMLDLVEKIKAGEGNVQDIQRQIARLDVDYQRTIDALEIKRENLCLAEEKLDELTRQKEDVKAERERAYKHLKKFDSDLIQQVRYRLIDGALAQIVPQFRQQMLRFGSESKQIFDGSFLRDFTEHGEEIMGNAVRLFLNTMDDVTDIGSTGGGGNSGNDLPWGRKEDEDDLAYGYPMPTAVAQDAALATAVFKAKMTHKNSRFQ